MQEVGQEYYNCDNIKLNPQSLSIQWKRAGNWKILISIRNVVINYNSFLANLLRHNTLVVNCKLKQKDAFNNISWKLNNIWTNSTYSEDCNILSKQILDQSCSSIHKNGEDVSNLVINPTVQSCSDKTNFKVYPTSMLKGGS